MIDSREIAAAARALRNVDDIADDHLEAAERRIGDVIEGNVKLAARRHRVTGRLERSITTKVTGSGAATVVRVTAGAPHAHLVAGGTRPHTIRPVRSHALPMHRGGSVVGFAERVEHPGTRPHPFFADGVDASDADVQRILDDTADALLGDLVTDMRRR